MNEQHNSPDQRPASDYGAHDFLHLGAEIGKGAQQDGGQGGQPRPSDVEGSWLLGESPEQNPPVVRQEAEQEFSEASEDAEAHVSGGWLMDGDPEDSSLQPAPTASSPRHFEGTYIEPENSREAFGRSLYAAILPGAGVILATVVLIGGWQLMKSSGNNAGGGGSERIEFKPPQRQEILVRPNVENVQPVAGNVGATPPAPAARVPARTHAEPGELSIWPSDVADDLVEPFELSEGPLAPEEAEAILSDLEGLLVDAAESTPDSSPAEYIDPLFNEEYQGSGSPPPAQLAMPVLISGWSRSLMGVPMADAVALFEPADVVEDPFSAEDVEVLDEPALEAVAQQDPVEAEVDELDAWLEHDGVIPFVAMGIAAEQSVAPSPEVIEFSSEDSVAMLSVSPWQDGFWAEFDEVERSTEKPFQASVEPVVGSEPVTDRVILVPVVDPQAQAGVGDQGTENPPSAENDSVVSPQGVVADVEPPAEPQGPVEQESDVVVAEDASPSDPASGEQASDPVAVVEVAEEVHPDEVVVDNVDQPTVESTEPAFEPEWSEEAVVESESSEVLDLPDSELQDSVVVSAEEVAVEASPDGSAEPSVENPVVSAASDDPIAEVSEQPVEVEEAFALSDSTEEAVSEPAVEAFEEPWEPVALGDEVVHEQAVEESFEPEWSPEGSPEWSPAAVAEVQEDSRASGIESDQVAHPVEPVAPGVEQVAGAEAEEQPVIEPTVEAFDEAWDEAWDEQWDGDLESEVSGDPVAEVHEDPADSIETVEAPEVALEPTVEVFDESYEAVAVTPEAEEGEAFEASPEPEVHQAWAEDLPAPEYQDEVAEAHPVDPETADPFVEFVDEPVAENSIEPVAEHFDEPVAESSDEPVAESSDEPVVDGLDEPVVQHSDEQVAESFDEPVAEQVYEPAVENFDEPAVAGADEPSEVVVIVEEFEGSEVEPVVSDESAVDSPSIASAVDGVEPEVSDFSDSDWVTAVDEDPTSQGQVWSADQQEAEAEVFVAEGPVEQEPWDEIPTDEVASEVVIVVEPEAIEGDGFEVVAESEHGDPVQGDVAEEILPIEPEFEGEDPAAEQWPVADADEPATILEVPGLEPEVFEGEDDVVAGSIQDPEFTEEPEVETLTDVSPVVAEALDSFPGEGPVNEQPAGDPSGTEEPAFDGDLAAGERPQSNLLDGGSLFDRYGSFLRTGRVPQSASVEGAEALAAAEEAAEAAADPEQVDISEFLPKRKGLARVGAEKRWDSVEVSDELLSSKVRLFTPFVGDVRVAVAGGGLVEGELHAVGSGSVWVDTRAGRLQLELERVERIDRMGTQGKLLEEDPDERDYTKLPRIRVRTAGGVFVGHEISREGDSVTLFTDEGLKITLKGAEVMPAQQRRSVLGMRPRQR